MSSTQDQALKHIFVLSSFANLEVEPPPSSLKGIPRGGEAKRVPAHLFFLPQVWVEPLL